MNTNAIGKIRIHRAVCEVLESRQHPSPPNAVFDGVMEANQVNHSTIVWWIQEDAILQLG